MEVESKTRKIASVIEEEEVENVIRLSQNASNVVQGSRPKSLADLLVSKAESELRSEIFKTPDGVSFTARKSKVSKPPPSDEVSRLIALMLAASSRTNENTNELSYIYDSDEEEEEEEEEEVNNEEETILSTKGDRAFAKLRQFQRNALILSQYHDDYVMELTTTIENLIDKLRKANIESTAIVEKIIKETDIQDEGNKKDMAHKREQLDMVLQTVMKTVNRWRRKVDKFETAMRKKRNQTESRLEGIIERYDAEMTNRQTLLDQSGEEEAELRTEAERLDKLNQDVQKRWAGMIAEIHVRQADEAMRAKLAKSKGKKKKSKKGKKGKKGSKKKGSKKKGAGSKKGKKGSKGGKGSKKKGGKPGGKSKKGKKGSKKKRKSKSGGESGEDESEFGEETGEEYETTDGEEEGATATKKKGSKKSKGKGSKKAKGKSAGKSKKGGRKGSKTKGKGGKSTKIPRSPPTPPPKDLEAEEEEAVEEEENAEEMEGEFDRPRNDSQQSQAKSKAKSIKKKKSGKAKKKGKRKKSVAKKKKK